MIIWKYNWRSYVATKRENALGRCHEILRVRFKEELQQFVWIFRVEAKLVG